MEALEAPVLVLLVVFDVGGKQVLLSHDLTFIDNDVLLALDKVSDLLAVLQAGHERLSLEGMLQLLVFDALDFGGLEFFFKEGLHVLAHFFFLLVFGGFALLLADEHE